jgi:hypothetical protein
MEASRRRSLLAAGGCTRASLVVLVLASAACGHRKHGPSVGQRAGQALAAGIDAAERSRAPWRCAAADTPAFTEEKVTVEGRVWQLTEHSLRGSFEDDELVIAVLGDAGGAATRTIAALGKLHDKLAAAHVDIAVVLGGMGATQAELEGTLGTLADRAAFATVVLAGDLEPETAQRAAIATLRKRGELVVDARQARFVELPGVTIGTLPGAGSPARLVAGSDGCGWRARDVSDLYAALATRESLRIAALAEAPRRAGPAGELGLAPADTEAVDVILHGAAAASPAREGSRDGTRVTLAPGSLDATTRLDTAGPPGAGLLVVRGKKWSWRPLVVD